MAGGPGRQIDVWLGNNLFEDAETRGSTVRFGQDGTAHVSHWANFGDGDRGVRISWDVGRDGSVSGVHGTDQNTNSRL